jgi:hypothetical protein
MPHDQDLLASFQRGEKRLIFARPIGGGDLVMLPDGQAQAWKARAKAELRCPIPDCAAPELTAVARRPRKRDGFSHQPGAGGHSAESYNHVEGKGQIARWLRDTYPDCTVVEEQSSNLERERVADVMITNPAGERIAFEIQYAAISPVDLARRSASYAAQGIRVVWLFGHVGAQLKRYRRGQGTAALTPTHEWMAKNGMPVYWFNPFSLEVAVATTGIIADGKQLDVAASDRNGSLVVAPLDLFSLRQSGFGSDFTRTLVANRGEADRREGAARAREEARVKRIEQINARREEERLQALERARAKWLSSDLRQRILTHFGGVMPPWLEAQIGGKLPFIASEWECTLYEQFILGRFEDATVSLSECTDALAGIVPVSREIRESIAAAWLVEMAKAGQITRIRECRWRASDDPRKFVTITRERAQERNDAFRSEPRTPLPRLAPPAYVGDFEDGTVEPRRSPSYAPRLGNKRRQPQIHAPVVSKPRCRICQDPLDPIYVEDGVHTICTRTGRR